MFLTSSKLVGQIFNRARSQKCATGNGAPSHQRQLGSEGEALRVLRHSPQKQEALAYAGFSKGGGAENLRTMKTKRKNFLLRLSPVFGPKLDEGQKKKERKKKVFTHISSGFVLKLAAQVTKRGTMPQFFILFYANYTMPATQWHCGLSKYAPGRKHGGLGAEPLRS